VSAILLTASFFLRLAGKWKVLYLWGSWFILWLIIPLPLNRDQNVIAGLQQLSSYLCSNFLDLVGINHLMDGNTLLLPAKQFFIDDACSGIVSLMSIVAFSLIYAIWQRRRPAHVAILLLAAVGWAVVMNALRITLIALLFDKAGMDWSSSTIHEIMSLIVFALIFLGVISSDMLLTGILAPIVLGQGRQAVIRFRYDNECIRLWNSVFAGREPLSQPSAPILRVH
jgi:exosortase